MGTVYEGFHLGLEKRVAVKVLPPPLAGQEEFLKRFLREAKAAAKLEHPHIVQVMNVGRKGKDYFIIMQIVEGESLAQKVEREECLPVETAARYIVQAADALGFAHGKGITHRDVKPDNILLGADDQIKVTDFGLAGRIDQRSSITNPDKILGTPYFMSPEQCRGEMANERSDIYSLGASFYYILTGTYPFQGDTAMSTLMKHLNEPLIPPHRLLDDVPLPVNDLVVDMMEKSPDKRPPSMSAVMSRLAGTVGETSLTKGALALPPKKPNVTAAIAGTIILALGLGAFLFVALGRGGSSEAESAFREAESYAREHPLALTEIAKFYGRVARAYPDTQEGRDAAAAADRYDQEAEQVLSREAKSAADRGETLYRKGDWAGAARSMEDFLRRGAKPTKLSLRFRALLKACRVLPEGESLSKELRFSEAAEVLAAYPDDFRSTEFGPDVDAARKLALSKSRILDRSRRFSQDMVAGRVENLPRYLGKGREKKESTLLVTAGRVIHEGVDITRAKVTAVTDDGGRFLAHHEVSGVRRSNGKTWTLREAFQWVEEGDDWVLEAGGRGDRWIGIALAIRIEDLVTAVNAGHEAAMISFLQKSDSKSPLWRFAVQKFIRDMRILTKLMKFKLREIPVEELEVDYKSGVVTTSGRPVLKSKDSETRSDKKWRVEWVPEGGTFKIRIAPKKPKGPRKR
jgi:hypothetical protein